MEQTTIDALAALSKNIIVKIDHEELGKLEFTIKPMSAKLLAQVTLIAKDLDISTKKEKKEEGVDEGDMKAVASFGQVVYPMCEILLPKCCVSPKVSLEETTEKGVLWIEKIPVEILIELFEGIYSVIVTNTKKKEDAIKN